MEIPNPLTLIAFVAAFAVAPLAVTMLTSFVKLSVVLMLLRNALGVQMIPPNMAIYGISMILTIYIMAPVLMAVKTFIEGSHIDFNNLAAIVGAADEILRPFHQFLQRHVDPAQLDFFVNSTATLWPKNGPLVASPDSYLILIPAFVTSELTNAFEIGFIIYLPFIVIDLIVSNLLLAMGMMMVSPVTISLPFKRLLFGLF